MALYGGIELGGTNIVCAYAEFPSDKLIVGVNKHEFKTTRNPEDAISEIVDFFGSAPEPVKSIGVASFGPLDLNRGWITTTPKPGWNNYPLVSRLKEKLGSKAIILETDVNGAVLGEWRYGIGKNLTNLVYVTIGTGIAVGIIVEGTVLHGFAHPEMGHIPVKLHHYDLSSGFIGICKFHQDTINVCLEGVASGEAIKSRWGWDDFDKHNADWNVAWEIEAYYIGQLVTTIVYTLSPELVILGGGVVMGQPSLINDVRKNVQQSVSGYLNFTQIYQDIEHFIVLPKLGDNAGIVGALDLARNFV